LEDTFYPHCRRHVFSDPTKRGKRILDVEADKAEVDRLLGIGWTKSAFPHSDSGNNYRNEADRRALECKWEPVVRRELTKNATSVCHPFLTIQAIGRNTVPDRFDYVVVVTVRASKYDGDLYTDIRTLYPALTPIRVRTEAEIRVQI
ncbi:MAG: hypothetical protein NT049_11470, partial [Planctomycetota bacterium]|nr:hypothetical protein [Planctomycetota bacterium]